MQESEIKEERGDISGSGDTVTVQTVRLENFRNYEALSLDLVPRFNVISGENGQGKTNLLESLYLMATTRLLRGQRDTEAIRDQEDRARASVDLSPSGTTLSVTLERGTRKRALLNGVALPRASDLIGRLPCVIVSSLDMEIVRGEPSVRRMFLDIELSALFPAYLRHLTHYKRALEQRNALLKDARERSIAGAVYEPWEDQLAEHGVAIRAIRRQFIERIEPRLVRIHSEMSNGEGSEVAYIGKDDATQYDELMRLLAEGRQGEVARGTTQVGPHRDDVALSVSGRESRLFGSQGQQRTQVIALKLATLEVARRERGIPPLLLLDDIFSDLDESRRSLLVDVVTKNAGQVVLTCTEPTAAGPSILDQAQVFEVRAGQIQAL